MSDNRVYPGTMQAVFLEKPGGRLVVNEVKIPDPEPNEVLIKMSAAPVNPSDLSGIKNAHIEYDLATFIPGLEGSGTVVAAGKGILPHLWLGKRVASGQHSSLIRYAAGSLSRCVTHFHPAVR